MAAAALRAGSSTIARSRRADDGKIGSWYVSMATKRIADDETVTAWRAAGCRGGVLRATEASSRRQLAIAQANETVETLPPDYSGMRYSPATSETGMARLSRSDGSRGYQAYVFRAFTARRRDHSSPSCGTEARRHQ